MRKPIFSLFVALCFSATTFAQSQQLGDSKIEVEVSINNQIIYIHKIQKGQTIYSLARYFKIPVQDLMIINDITAGQIISIDSEIKIPIDRNKLQTPLEKLSDEWVPIIYKVKKGETLYSMSNSYFPQRMDHLIARNEIQSFYVRSDQELIIGWWGKDVAGADEGELESELELELELELDSEVVELTDERNTVVDVTKEIEETVEEETVQEEENIVSNRVPKSQSVDHQINENNNASEIPEVEAADESYKEEFVLDIITQVMEERDNPPGRTAPTNIEAPENISSPTATTRIVNGTERSIPHAPNIDNTVRERNESSSTKEDIAGDEGNLSEDITGEEMSDGENTVDIGDSADVNSDLEGDTSEGVDSLAIAPPPLPKYSLVTRSKTGIGLWDKNDPDATNLYVFHRTAKINSIVKLHNPVTDRTVNAVVIGHILDKIYSKDIDVVVTRGVAVSLGAMDSRFSVDIKYTEKVLN